MQSENGGAAKHCSVMGKTTACWRTASSQGHFAQKAELPSCTSKFSPVEKSEELQVVLTCQGKAFPLTRTGSRFRGELEVPADTVCRISQVTVTSEQAVQTASLGWVINTKDMIFPQVESTYYGKGKSVPAGEPATFSGTIECTVSWPGILREEIVDAELIKRINGQACDSHSLRVVIWRKGACSREGLRRRHERSILHLPCPYTLDSGLELYHTALDLPQPGVEHFMCNLKTEVYSRTGVLLATM